MVKRSAEWTIHGHRVNIFEIESNYIARIYHSGKCTHIRVFKKDWLNRLGSVYKALSKELAVPV